jgi:hypothetical protein
LTFKAFRSNTRCSIKTITVYRCITITSGIRKFVCAPASYI